MKLYYAPGTCAVSVWIALHWVGADFETERVVLGSDEYKKINPAGTVPALDTGDKDIKTQAGPILSYIASKYKQKDLGPDEGLENEFIFNEMSVFLSADYHPAFWPMFSPQEYTTSTDEDDLKKVVEAAYKKIDSVASLLDNKLEGRTHIYKNKRTVLDAYAYILSRWLVKTPKSWTDYPNLKKFMETMEKDEEVQKIIELSTKKI